MMNQIKRSVILLLVFFCIKLHANNQDRYYRSIDVKDTGWHALLLPPEIYLRAKADLSDVRIYKITDKDSLEVPYIRMTNEFPEAVLWSNLKLFNTVKSGSRSFVSVELQKGKSIVLDLKFNSLNFDIVATVEGSNDGINWFLISDSLRFLALHKGNDFYNYTKCSLDDIEFRFLRIAYPNSNNLNLNIVLQRTRKEEEVELSNVSLKVISTETKNKVSTFTFRLDVPQEISKIIPAVVFQGEYDRHFTLYGYHDSIEGNKKWIKNYFEIANGRLNSYGDNSIAFSPELVKGFELRINNDDNISLNMSSVKGSIFPVLLKTYFSDLNGRYVVAYGDHSLSTPNYDLATFKSRIPLLTDTLSVLAEKTIPFVVKRPLFSLPDNLLWFVLLAIIVLLTFFTFKMIKAKA